MSAAAVQSQDSTGFPMDAVNTDHERFLALVERHRRALLKIGWTYTRTSHDRDDLLQETIGRLWSAFGGYDSSRPFSTWMYRVALNVAIDFQRRQKRWRRDESQSVDQMARDYSEESEQLRDLRELLDQQSDGDRALLVLHLEGHSHREIGDVLGISESNVGTRLSRIRTSLRQTALESENAREGKQ